MSFITKCRWTTEWHQKNWCLRFILR